MKSQASTTSAISKQDKSVHSSKTSNHVDRVQKAVSVAVRRLPCLVAGQLSAGHVCEDLTLEGEPTFPAVGLRGSPRFAFCKGDGNTVGALRRPRRRRSGCSQGLGDPNAFVRRQPGRLPYQTCQ